MKPKESHRAATRIDTHGHRPVRSATDSGSADRNARRTHPLSVRILLDVMSDFDQFGGASLELVAWELYIDESAVSAAWSRAIADGLIERSETHEVPGEETWKLTTWGRSALASSDDVCQLIVRHCSPGTGNDIDHDEPDPRSRSTDERSPGREP